MNEELGKTIKLFLIWLFLLYGTQFISGITGHVFKNIEIAKWVNLLGYMLIAILFFGKGYVRLSFGRIERRMVWPAVGMSVLVAAAHAFAICSVFLLLDVDLFFSGEELERRQQLFSGIAGVLLACAFGPIVEEIGFRGILLGGLLMTRCRPWLAILISALVFALFHRLGANFVSALSFGIISGWLYWRTESIIPGIIIHITHNLLTAIDISNRSKTFYWIILVVGLLLLAFGLWWFWKKCNFAKT